MGMERCAQTLLSMNCAGSFRKLTSPPGYLGRSGASVAGLHKQICFVRSKCSRRFASLLAASSLAGAVLLSASAFAANFTVTNANDSGAGSLRQAIADANAAGGTNVITMQPGLGAINLASNLPIVATSVTIVGGGNTLDGAGAFRGFLISGIASDGQNAAATSVTISNLTIQNVKAQGGNGGLGGWRRRTRRRWRGVRRPSSERNAVECHRYEQRCVGRQRWQLTTWGYQSYWRRRRRIGWQRRLSGHHGVGRRHRRRRRADFRWWKCAKPK